MRKRRRILCACEPRLEHIEYIRSDINQKKSPVVRRTRHDDQRRASPALSRPTFSRIAKHRGNGGLNGLMIMAAANWRFSPAMTRDGRRFATPCGGHFREVQLEQKAKRRA